MVTKEITHEEVVQKEEELTICDDCGKQVDPNGDTLSNGGRPDSLAPENTTIDLCSKCLSRLNEDTDSPAETIRKEWWTEPVVVGATRESVIKRVNLMVSAMKFVTGVAMVIMALVAVVSVSMATAVPPVAAWIMVASLLLLLFVCLYEATRTKEAMDKATKNLRR
jgi:hypothetical protein